MLDTYLAESDLGVHEWITRINSCHPQGDTRGTGSTFVDKSCQFHKHLSSTFSSRKTQVTDKKKERKKEIIFNPSRNLSDVCFKVFFCNKILNLYF
jgi:hypothetical protein